MVKLNRELQMRTLELETDNNTAKLSSLEYEWEAKGSDLGSE